MLCIIQLKWIGVWIHNPFCTRLIKNLEDACATLTGEHDKRECVKASVAGLPKCKDPEKSSQLLGFNSHFEKNIPTCNYKYFRLENVFPGSKVDRPDWRTSQDHDNGVPWCRSNMIQVKGVSWWLDIMYISVMTYMQWVVYQCPYLIKYGVQVLQDHCHRNCCKESCMQFTLALWCNPMFKMDWLLCILRYTLPQVEAT